ncbi:hypothetical protein HK104_000251 [Borealophlyctis nickersoniae]|nr:hypothetical protein HK104_000251 [Borealophlyctis nickersoniae]
MSIHVIIVGAGLGGLALAQGLKKHNISFSIFERDQSSAYRPQGYRLRIRPDGTTGLQTVLPDDVWNLFRSTAATTGFGFTDIDAITGEQIPSAPWGPPPSSGAPGGNRGPPQGSSMVYTADRTTLRHVLLTGLEDKIQFGKEFKSFRHLNENGNGNIQVEFADGTTADGTLLVAADGLHSGIRKQALPSHHVLDTRGRCIYGKTPITPALESEWHHQGRTGIVMYQDSRPLTLFTESVRFPQNPHDVSDRLPSQVDYVYWVLLAQSTVFGVPDSDLFAMSKEEIKHLALTLTEKWHPSIRAVINHSPPDLQSQLRITSAAPDIPTWTDTVQNVTFLGDAIHPMSPTGGQGLNAALRDAGALTEAIVKGASREEMRKYEEGCRELGGKAIEESQSSFS